MTSSMRHYRTLNLGYQLFEMLLFLRTPTRHGSWSRAKPLNLLMASIKKTKVEETLCRWNLMKMQLHKLLAIVRNAAIILVAFQQFIDGYAFGTLSSCINRGRGLIHKRGNIKIESRAGNCRLFHPNVSSLWQASPKNILPRSPAYMTRSWEDVSNDENKYVSDDENMPSDLKSKYSLGIGKNQPLSVQEGNEKDNVATRENDWVDSSSGRISTLSSNDTKLSNTTQTELREEVFDYSVAQNWNFQFGTVNIIEPPSKNSSSLGPVSKSTKSKVMSQTNITSGSNEGKAVSPNTVKRRYTVGLGKNRPLVRKVARQKQTKLVKYGDSDDKSKLLSKSVDTDHYGKSKDESSHTKLQPLELQYKLMPNGSANNEQNFGDDPSSLTFNSGLVGGTTNLIRYDVQIPESTDDYVYDPENGVDTVWDVMRYEAFMEAQREPLLVSFLFSTILNHKSLESALAFHLANRLASPAMISTQVMSLCLEAMTNSPDFGRALRKDMLAVRDRDPACSALPDVFLYFKGFHALQTYRVAHFLFRSGRRLLSSFLQSQMSQVFQIDIHPNATLGEGIMLDHGTGIVIGETAIVGHNCSILHHVTLGGSGKKGVKRHPNIGNGVLVGAGASVLGNIRVGDGSQIGAGSLVVEDVPPHCVVVGVPGKVIGSFIDVNVQPSISMNQTLSETAENLVPFAMDGI